jgi:hypothetical protein
MILGGMKEAGKDDPVPAFEPSSVMAKEEVHEISA